MLCFRYHYLGHYAIILCFGTSIIENLTTQQHGIYDHISYFLHYKMLLYKGLNGVPPKSAINKILAKKSVISKHSGAKNR